MLILKEPEEARQELISKGYIYNEVYGWEKPEILERFGLNLNMKGIPSIEVNDYTLQKRKIREKDPFGRDTIEREEMVRIENPDKKIKIIDPKWINYYEWKKEGEMKRVRENIAKTNNEVPVEIYGDNF